jgi:hypothetical protein
MSTIPIGVTAQGTGVEVGFPAVAEGVAVAAWASVSAEAAAVLMPNATKIMGTIK